MWTSSMRTSRAPLSKKIWLLSSAVVFLAVTAFHALMVCVINMPDNALKSALDQELALYAGPHLTQSWSLFAPDVSATNLHVIVRGRYPSGETTPWYDATEFFQDAMERNRFTTLRPISEGLYHSSNLAVIRGKIDPNTTAGIVLVRTAAMVLETYTMARRPVEMQVEIDASSITMGRPRTQAKRTQVLKLAWMIFPKVPGF
jgi:hypothetical protein